MSRNDILARILSVIAFTIASTTTMPSAVRAQDTASGASQIDPAAAVLTPADLGDGWAVQGERRYEAGYWVLLSQRDDASFRTGRLVLVMTDIRMLPYVAARDASTGGRD